MTDKSSAKTTYSTYKLASIKKGKFELKYYIPNRTCEWRVETLFSKEPHTLKWLRRIDKDEYLLDIGANVGMYSIYAAIMCSCNVYAFEPESQSFSTLCKNIYLNNLHSKILAFPIALSDIQSFTKFHLSKFLMDGGESCHAAGESFFDFSLQQRQSPFYQGAFTITIDEAISMNAIKIPQFIKIDIDGFEHKVINGAQNCLGERSLKSICIEINTNLKEHLDILKKLQKFGFYYRESQLQEAIRKEGPFKGCAEIILDRFKFREITLIKTFGERFHDWDQKSSEEIVKSNFSLVAPRVRSTKTIYQPFPHLIVENIFPEELYKCTQKYFPDPSEMHSISEDSSRVKKDSYKRRNIFHFNIQNLQKLSEPKKVFWASLYQHVSSYGFIEEFLRKFEPWIANNLSEISDQYNRIHLISDAMLVNDQSNYQLGPHTDLPTRLLSILIYLPSFDQPSIGTSLYQPIDPQFNCRTGKHYRSKGFTEVKKIPFKPNTLLAFPRTNQSFHGVETLKIDNLDRKMLMINMQLEDLANELKKNKRQSELFT